MKSNDAGFSTITILLYGINRGFYFINQIGVEDIEFVSLHNLRWWIVVVIVSLIVFVPLVPSVNSVKVLRLSGTVFVMPPVHLHPPSCGVKNTMVTKRRTIIISSTL